MVGVDVFAVVDVNIGGLNSGGVGVGGGGGNSRGGCRYIIWGITIDVT